VTTSLVLDYDGTVYAADVAAGTAGTSGGLCAVGSQRLVVFADAAHGVGSGSIALTTTIKVIPRYALWAPDGTYNPGFSM